MVVQAAIAKHKASEAEWTANSIKRCTGACEEAARFAPHEAALGTPHALPAARTISLYRAGLWVF